MNKDWMEALAFSLMVVVTLAIVAVPTWALYKLIAWFTG